MYGSFDAYQQWLGIAPSERPVHHYRLLGLAPLETNPAAILRAIEEREAYVRAMAAQSPEAAQDILEDLASARHLLLSPSLKAQYDAMLAQQQPGLAAAEFGPPGIAPWMPAPVSPAPVSPAPVSPAPVSPAPVYAPESAPPVAPPRSAAPQSPPAQNGAGGETAGSFWSQPAVIVAAAGGTVLVGLLLLLVLGGGGADETARTGKRSPSVGSRNGDGDRVARNGKTNGRNNGSGSGTPSSAPTWRKGTAPPLGSRTMADLMSQGEDSPLDKNSTTGLLAATRKALADRQIETARNHLDAAQGMARSPTEKAEAERLQKLVEAVEGFWTAVREVAEKLQGGDEIRIGDNMCIVVQNEGGRLIVRADGRNRDYEIIRGLPRQLAIGIVQKRMPGDGPAANLRIGAFLAVDARGDRQQARQRLEKAGAEGRALLPEIDLAGPVKPGPAGDSGPDPAMRVPDDPGGFKPQPAPGDKRLPVPDAAALAAAEKQVRDELRSEFAAAKDKEAKVALAKKLYDRAEKTKDGPAVRYSLYQAAHDLALELGDPESFLWAVDRMAERFQVDGVQMKAEDLATAWRDQTDVVARLAVYRASLKLLDESMKAKHYQAADRAVRVALAGANAAKDFALVRDLEQKARQIRDGL